MIRQRFDVFAGIGATRAKAIGQAGIHDWNDFLDTEQIRGISPALKSSVDGQIREWSRAIEKRDHRSINRILPRGEHWSLYRLLGDSIRCLDIETTKPDQRVRCPYTVQTTRGLDCAIPLGNILSVGE